MQKISIHRQPHIFFLLFQIIISSFFHAPVSWATQIRGVNFPEQIQIENKKLLLNGVGIRKKTIFNIEVYASALYLEKPTHNFQNVLDNSETKSLELVFLRNVKAKHIVESWEEGFKKYCEKQCKELAPQLEELSQLMTDVKKFQRITFVFFSDHFTITTLNQPPKAFQGKEFENIILSTFIGKDPPTVELRNGLMGLTKFPPK